MIKLGRVQAAGILKSMMEEHVVLTYELSEQTGVLAVLMELIERGFKSDDDLERVIGLWKSGDVLLIFPAGKPIGTVGFKRLH